MEQKHITPFQDSISVILQDFQLDEQMIVLCVDSIIGLGNLFPKWKLHSMQFLDQAIWFLKDERQSPLVLTKMLELLSFLLNFDGEVKISALSERLIEEKNVFGLLS